MGIEISVTEFKAKCLELLDKVSRNEIDSIEVTKRGRPLATVTAAKAARARTREEAMAQLREWQENLKGSIQVLDPDLDLTEPVFDIEDFDAYHGRVFPGDD